ncbi:hypothetical protein [Streptomyces sp. NPDC059743]|uniref:hypothetical protein n=1 Tax=Streptomyces sp. NPDC059743 TaxID=3346928 RepID=UPI00365D1F7B
MRASLEADAAAAQKEFLALMDLVELDADPVATAPAPAFTALQAEPECRRCVLAMLVRTPEAEAELSGVDPARQALVAAREAAKKNTAAARRSRGAGTRGVTAATRSA